MSMKPHKDFVRYSPDEISNARECDTLDVISKTEGFTFERAGSEWHCKEHDSLVVFRDRKGWTWYARDLKGPTAIDWLMTVRGMEFKEAVGYLIGDHRDSSYSVSADRKRITERRFEQVKKEDIPEKPKELVLPEKAQGQYKRVGAYLTISRGLDAEVVNYCIQNKQLYQDVKGNCVFLGHDEQGEVKFATTRGTLSNIQYRGDCAGSDKNYSFRMDGTIKQQIFVFEAPIDLLSHATLHKLRDQLDGREDYKTSWQKVTRLTLSGFSDKALDHYLEGHPEVKRINFCLDKDEKGLQRTEKMKLKYAEKGFNVKSFFVPEGQGKDWNDYLVNYRNGANSQQQAVAYTTQRKR
ncbi:MAG: DUF3991 and TOPRIM domain-containing protein [Oscillospiraceae bacterium]